MDIWIFAKRYEKTLTRMKTKCNVESLPVNGLFTALMGHPQILKKEIIDFKTMPQRDFISNTK